MVAESSLIETTHDSLYFCQRHLLDALSSLQTVSDRIDTVFSVQQLFPCLSISLLQTKEVYHTRDRRTRISRKINRHADTALHLHDEMR